MKQTAPDRENFDVTFAVELVAQKQQAVAFLAQAERCVLLLACPSLPFFPSY